MLIKVKPNFYINSDNISTVHFKDNKGMINLRGLLVIVSEQAALFVLQMMEVKDAVILPGEDAPEVPSLKTRIAQMLRDTWKGASFQQLCTIFPHESEVAIRDALLELYTQRVIVKIDMLWYHASSSKAQRQLMSNRDLSTASAALPDDSVALEEHSEPTVVLKTES